MFLYIIVCVTNTFSFKNNKENIQQAVVLQALLMREISDLSWLELRLLLLHKYVYVYWNLSF